MRYRRSLIDILESVVTEITSALPTITIYLVSGAGPYVLNVNDVSYATFGETITIGGKPYTVTAVDDTSDPPTLTVKDPGSSGAPATGTFQMYTIFFFHGTPKATDTEVILKLDPNEKYPMVWLWEEYKETYTEDRTEAIERTVPVKLFFLQKGKSDKMMTDDLTTNYVKPMEKLRDIFIDTMANMRDVFQREKFHFDSTPKTRFGVIAIGKGDGKQLFADDLAGVQVDMTLKIYKPGSDCKC